MLRWFHAGLVLSAATLCAAYAQTPAPAAATNPVDIVQLHINVDVNADGTFTQTTDQLLLLKTQQGVQAVSTALVSYSESLQEGDLLQVYTLKADGRRIEAPLAQVLTRSAPMAVTAPMFSDFKIKALAYQNVEVGDQVGVVTRIRQKTPLVPGQFSFIQVFSQTQPAQDVQLVVTAPSEGYGLQAESVGLDAVPPTIANGVKTWRWTFKNEDIRIAEAAGVADFDVAPRVVLSNYSDFAALAKAYESRALAQSTITPPIQELADRLTMGIQNRREQARVLYEWVSQNIKYVAINLGVGAIVPHAASEVLSNLYGDCKDHVVLLQALLKAKGIDSTPALINAGNSFKISALAALQQFNHVITYIPELNLYVDSTARYTPFGVLPFPDGDKTVLLTASGKLDQTPWTKSPSVFETVTTLKVHDDGSADGETRISTSGPIAISARGSIASVSAGQEQNFLRQMVNDSGGGSLDRGEPDQLVEPYTFGMRFKLSNYLQMPGPGAISFTPGPNMGGRMSWIASVNLSPRTRDFICPSGRYVEQHIVELPASVKISVVPKPQEMTIEGLKLKTTYVLEGERGIRATRTVDIVEPHRYCPAERASRLRAEFVKMNSALGAQALYE